MSMRKPEGKEDDLVSKEVGRKKPDPELMMPPPPEPLGFGEIEFTENVPSADQEPVTHGHQIVQYTDDARGANIKMDLMRGGGLRFYYTPNDGNEATVLNVTAATLLEAFIKQVESVPKPS